MSHGMAQNWAHNPNMQKHGCLQHLLYIFSQTASFGPACWQLIHVMRQENVAPRAALTPQQMSKRVMGRKGKTTGQQAGAGGIASQQHAPPSASRIDTKPVQQDTHTGTAELKSEPCLAAGTESPSTNTPQHRHTPAAEAAHRCSASRRLAMSLSVVALASPRSIHVLGL